MSDIRVRIDSDEYYPFFYLTERENWTTAVDVDDETLCRWRRVMAMFEAVQGEMEEAIAQTEREQDFAEGTGL